MPTATRNVVYDTPQVDQPLQQQEPEVEHRERQARLLEEMLLRQQEQPFSPNAARRRDGERRLVEEALRRRQVDDPQLDHDEQEPPDWEGEGSGEEDYDEDLGEDDRALRDERARLREDEAPPRDHAGMMGRDHERLHYAEHAPPRDGGGGDPIDRMMRLLELDRAAKAEDDRRERAARHEEARVRAAEAAEAERRRAYEAALREEERAKTELRLMARMDEREARFRETLEAERRERAKREAEKEERIKSEKMLNAPEKLRTDGMPTWPSKHQGAVYPFFIFAEDFIVWLSMIGYDEIIKADPLDPSINDKADNTALRYLCAAINDQTICTHLADQFRAARSTRLAPGRTTCGWAAEAAGRC